MKQDLPSPHLPEEGRSTLHFHTPSTGRAGTTPDPPWPNSHEGSEARAFSGMGSPSTVTARPTATAARMLYTLCRPMSGVMICSAPTGVRTTTCGGGGMRASWGASLQPAGSGVTSLVLGHTDRALPQGMLIRAQEPMREQGDSCQQHALPEYMVVLLRGVAGQCENGKTYLQVAETCYLLTLM